MTTTTPSPPSVVQIARAYYNNASADHFYATVWGGEYIHVGIYEQPDEPVFQASHRIVVKIVSLLQLNATSRVLDIGAGYGGSARYLAKNLGCQVDCLNLSEVHNEHNRQTNQEQGLQDKIQVIQGNFEAIPLAANYYHAVWSQDAMVHSGNRYKVVEEAYRVLQAGGEFIFTDLMQSDDCPSGVLQPVLDRIHLDSMGSMGFYRKSAETVGFTTVQIIPLNEQLVNHYSRILREVDTHYAEMVKACDKEYIDRMRVGLNHWIQAGKKGHLTWGILHFRKPK